MKPRPAQPIASEAVHPKPSPMPAARAAATALGEALATIVREAVMEAVREAFDTRALGEPSRPARVDCTTMAQLLDCSPAQVHRLCRDGMPFVRLGEVKRFDPEAVYTWLDARTAERQGKP